jgi:ribosomal protein L37AE/L43A
MDLKQYFEFTAKQTSKGLWYCDKCSVWGSTVTDTSWILKDAITEINKVLDEVNQAQDPKVQEVK